MFLNDILKMFKKCRIQVFSLFITLRTRICKINEKIVNNERCIYKTFLKKSIVFEKSLFLWLFLLTTSPIMNKKLKLVYFK